MINSTELGVGLITISETSPKEKHNFNVNIALDGYRLPFYTGSKSSRGGVAIYTKSDLSVFERDGLKVMDVNFEAVWIEIEVEKGKNIICGCVYRHPSSDMTEFINYISKCLTTILKENKECYVMEDFNVDLLKYDTCSKHKEFLNTMISFGFFTSYPTTIKNH